MSVMYECNLSVIYECNGKATAHERSCRAYLLLVTTWIYKISSCADSRWMTFFVIRNETCVETQTSKVPTRVALLFISIL